MGDDAENGRGGGCRSSAVLMVPESARRRRRAGRPGSSNVMLAGVLCCWRGYDGRMMPSKKIIGDAAAVIDGWISSFGLGYKNRALMMLWSALKMAREATLPTTKGMESSQRAAAGDDALRPRRIGGELLVTDVMDDADCPMECPPLMGLPATQETVAATVGMVETSLLLVGGCRI
ncbi:hypothetical protein ACLOJK_004991 [Asimina triloba]